MQKVIGLAIVALPLVACAPDQQASAIIEGVLGLDSGTCTANAGSKTFLSSSTLDIGTPRSLTVALKVRTNLPSTFSTQNVTEDRTRSPNYPVYGGVDNNILTFESSEVFYTTDSDAENAPALSDPLPLSDDRPEVSGVSGVGFNEQTQLLTPSVVFASVISQENAEALADDPFVSEILGSGEPNGSRARIFLNIRIVGNTTGGAEIRTPAFPFPVDLCRECLTAPPDCGEDATGAAIEPVPNPKVCTEGQDIPSFVCPN